MSAPAYDPATSQRPPLPSPRDVGAEIGKWGRGGARRMGKGSEEGREGERRGRENGRGRGRQLMPSPSLLFVPAANELA